MAETLSQDLPTSDELIAATASFLIEGGEDEAASIILSCSVVGIEEVDTSGSYSKSETGVRIHLRGSRQAYTVLTEWQHGIGEQIRAAIKAVLPHDTYLEETTIRLARPVLGPEWKFELQELANGKSVSNQGISAPNTFSWQGLRFRSPAETKIAESLDRAKVMFFPLCLGRLNMAQQRVNREPDFLVCHQGKWGILEVDGRQWHQGLAAEDHQRDRMFQRHGVKVVVRFTGKQCLETPAQVVDEFLALLEKNG